ncbi:MAG: hypothetical protein J0I12_18610 [Candidatus Eremiobacteraeota bacterium]|nr:hypothetical protein [Candidatus Eremiobacteraeota bacterium]
MMKFELPNVVPAAGNPFTPMPVADLGSPMDVPVAITRPEKTEPPKQEETEETQESAPIATTMAQLIDSMQQAEGLFKQAFQLALTTRNRETELMQRAEEAERDSRHHEREALEWQQRYQALDQKIPKWVRKLFRAS